MVKNREGQLKQNNTFNAPSYLSTVSYKCNRFSPRRDIWFTGDLHYSPSLVHDKKIKTICVLDLPFFSLTSVASRGRNEMYRIPRENSGPRQGIVNPKWQMLPLRFSDGHLFMSEVLGSNVELMKILLKSPSPVQAEACCASLQTVRMCSGLQDTACPCPCIPALCKELV